MESSSLEVNEINVITLNCWGLKFLADLRNERLTEIGKAIGSASPTPHIVGLQECWTQEDYKSIRKETKHILPYGKFYHSGIFGGGLAILSKWPIEESSMFRYPLNGRPTAFFRGDWFVGKGVAGARIRYGQGPKDIVEVFTTHVGTLKFLCMTILILFSSMHPTKQSHTILISAIEQHKHGK